jgi:hypothetical protein
MSRVEFPGEISTRRLQDLIRPPQFPDFPLQLRDPLLIITRRAGPLPGIHFRFPHSVAEILGAYARPVANPRDRLTRVPCFIADLEDHCYRAFQQFHRMRLP